MNNQALIVVCPVTGARLCKDNQYRKFAAFGTFGACVKVYRKKAYAERAAIKYRTKAYCDHVRELREKGEKLIPHTHIVHLSENDSMDAGGNVFRNGQLSTC